MVNKDELFYESMKLIEKKGKKFTMDELAQHLGISKRTLYETVHSKNDLSIFLVERYFLLVDRAQKPIQENTDIDLAEKVRELLVAAPEISLPSYRMSEFREGYPQAYALLEHKLSHDWRKIFKVMDQGVKQGIFRTFDKNLFVLMYTSSIEGLTMKYNQESKKSLLDMQQKIVDMLLQSIMK